MTTIPVENMPGKYQVLFNGTQLACYNDTDCPGAGICAINQTWSMTPGGWCMCNTRSGLTGQSCNDFCENGVAKIVVGVLVICLSLYVCTVGCMSLGSSIARRNRPVDNLNVLNVLLSSLTLGSLFIMLYVIIAWVASIGFPTYYEVVIAKGREMRRTSQDVEYANFILLVLAQCISANAPLLLPLVWIEMTNIVFKFQRGSVRAIKFLSISFCCLVCFVQFPLYILASTNFQGQVAYFGMIAADIWYVVYGFLILVNLTAIGNVVKVRRQIYDRPQSEVTERFLELLNRVLISACLLVASFVIIIGLIVGAQERQFRTYYNDPTCNIVGGSWFTLSDLCLRLAIFFLEGVSAICLWFLRPDTKKLMRSTMTRTANDPPIRQQRKQPEPAWRSHPPKPQRDAHVAGASKDEQFKTDSQSGFGLDKQEIMVV